MNNENLIKQTMVETEMLNDFQDLVKSKKQYHKDDCGIPNRCTKVFNNGSGRLDFLVLYTEEKILLINKSIANVYDYRHIEPFVKKHNLNLVEKHFGYPEWYSQRLGLTKEQRLAYK